MPAGRPADLRRSFCAAVHRRRGAVSAGRRISTCRAADRRALPLAGLCLGLSALTRPEGYLFFGLLSLHLLATQLQSRRALAARGEATPRWFFDGRSGRRVGLFLALTVPHLAFRRLYLRRLGAEHVLRQVGGRARHLEAGRLLPVYVPARSEAGGAAAALRPGLLRLLASARPAKSICAWAWSPTASRPCFSPTYVASVGGDFMGASSLRAADRAAAGGVRLLGLFTSCVSVQRRQRSAGWACCCATPDQHLLCRSLCAVVHRRRSRHRYAGLSASLRRRPHRHRQVAGAARRPDDYQGRRRCRSQVYYAGIRALDSFGLCDAYVAKQTPPLSSRPGHQKFAPLGYVLSRTPPPTILTYNVYRIAAAPYQPDAGEAAMWRSRGFHYVSVPIPGLSQPWYSFLKRIDRRLGPLPALSDSFSSP